MGISISPGRKILMKMKDFKRIFVIIVVFSIFLNFNISREVIAEEVPKTNVLVLNSYDSDSEYSRDIIDGIKSKLKKNNSNIHIKTEYMDCRRNGESSTYFQLLFNIYKYKYQNKKNDLVISIGSGAYDFLVKNSQDLFPQTPIAFCGAPNYQSQNTKGLELFTGIAERIDLGKTIEVAMKLKFETKQINIFLNKGSNYDYLLESLEVEKSKLKKNVKISVFTDLTLDEAENEIGKLSSNNIIIMDASFKDKEGEFVPLEDSIKQLSKKSKIPIFSDFDEYINCGIVGGKVNMGENQGKRIAEIGNMILDGDKPSSIKIIEDNFDKEIFNYSQLNRFKINEKDLPNASIIIDKPAKNYIIARKIVFSCILCSLFLILLASKVFLINKMKRIKVERNLRKSEELLRTLINASPDLICFKDGHGKWLEANVSMLKLFKIGLFDYKGMENSTISQFSQEWNEDLYQFEESDEDVWTMGTIMREEKNFKDANGESRIYDVIKVPIFRTDNSRNGLVVLGRDVTERAKVSEFKKSAEESKKILDELREYDKVKTEFFANLSHELKTPLNVIFGAVQLLELIQQNGEMLVKEDNIANYTNIMKQNCFRLLRIVNNLIDITKIDSGYFQLELHNYDIVYVIENITLSVKDYVESKGIELIFDTDIEEKKMAFDPDKMERILLNLLSNAIKFTNKNGTILVTLHDYGENVIISVKDTGIGIPIDKQKAVFERFIQVDKSLSRNREGSGIGLSLVRSLVELHNGKITLKSEIDKGSEFIIELPVFLVPNEEPIIDIDQIKESNIEKIKIEFSDIYS